MVKNLISLGVIGVLIALSLFLSGKIGELKADIKQHQAAIEAQESSIAKSYESALNLENELQKKEVELVKINQQSNSFRQKLYKLQSQKDFKDWHDTALPGDARGLLKGSGGNTATANSATAALGSSQ